MHSETEKQAIRAAVEQARKELAQAVPNPPARKQREPIVPQYTGPRMGYKFRREAT